MQVISRSAGRSVVAAAAYRAGERLHDRRLGNTHDYHAKKGVMHSEIMLPADADQRLGDRSHLWNQVEAVEMRKDAQLAREVTLALPHDLTPDQRLKLAQGFVRDNFVSHGMVADLNIHAPQDGRGEDERNHHAHVMLTLRTGTPDGLSATKNRYWNDKALLEHWREQWAKHQNNALERAGHDARVDHRSLARQLDDATARHDKAAMASLDRLPEQYMGPPERGLQLRYSNL